jgi:hypothetical protein
MTRMQEEAPTVETIERGAISRHPAFGQITVSRVSGRRTLYGSDFVHNGYIRVSIYASEQHRTDSRDWPFHGVRPLIEIDMSEAQWGSFVSSFSIGEGTRCTLVSVAGERKPEIPYEDRDAIHKAEANEAVAEAMADLHKLREKIVAGTQGLTKARQQEMLSAVTSAINALSSHLPFIADSFAKQMEKRVEKAKTEVHAYVTNTIMRAGLASIGGEGPLQLSGPNDPV